MNFIQISTIKDVPVTYVSVATACVSVYVSYRLCVYGHYRYRLALTKKKIMARREEREQNISAMRAHLMAQKEAFDPDITSLRFEELQRKLFEGELKAVDVLMAFQHHALKAHQELNCVTEFLEEALDRARQLDQLPSNLRGPLHGIPVSLKESIGLAGRDSTIGFAKSIGVPFQEDSVLVKVLLDQGAVPFVRTNVPQALMSLECSNPIFGVTRNPHNPQRTSGGSSGGEGALIGAGASVLGIGCDMGGSNRGPAHFCGVAGFKSTPNRLSNAGNCRFGLGIVSLAEVYSPLGRDVTSLVAYMKATLVPRLYQLDPLIPTLPWNDQLYRCTKPLTIGYYTHDGGVEPVPAVERAVMVAVKNLEAMGHTVVEFQPPDVLYMFEHLFMAIIGGDGGCEALNNLQYDVIDPCIEAVIHSCQSPMPSFMKKLISLLLGMHPITKILINYEWPRNVSEWWEKNEELEAYKRMYCDQLASKGIECLVCPALPFPAWPVGLSQHNFEADTYMSLYNVLAFPAGVVPTTIVTAKDVEQMKSYPSNTDVHKFVHEITRGSEDLPVGVQCVGLPFQDETVLRLMKDLESSLQASTD